MFGAWVMAALALTVGGCGSSDIDPGTQIIGQRCYSDVDCADGLECSQRRLCVAPAPMLDPGETSSANNPNNPNNVNNTSAPNNGGNVAPNDDPNNGGNVAPNGDPNVAPNGEPNNENNEPNNDAPNIEPNNDDPNVDPNNENNVPNNDDPNNIQLCEIGDRSCVTPFSYEICVQFDDGGTDLIERRCPEGSQCENGRCRETCRDNDGDGTFENCDPFDCDDTTPRRSPFNEEVCDDGIDNNCNRRVDEGCQADCCANCGGPGAFCVDCQCQMVNPSVCSFQNQPCTNLDSFNNGLYCADFTGNGTEGVCVGLCDQFVNDPASTCPSPNQACAFGDPNGGQGICFDTCNRDTDCGNPNSGCLAYNTDEPMSQGICTPADPSNPIGAPCDEFGDGPFGCAPGGICTDVNQQMMGATCTQTCRPFLAPPSDCAAGTYCAAFSADLGVCTQDNGRGQGQACNRIYSTCGDDNVVCLPTQNVGPRCRALCRLNLGDQDCDPMQFCRSTQQDSNIGVCSPR